jgi:quercetin dioxygenase-like cupin family protein
VIMKKRLIAISALCLALAPAAIAQADKMAETKSYLPGEGVWQDADGIPPGAKVAVLEGDPGKEVFYTMRVKFPEGLYKIAPHTHPVGEHLTVISGTFNMGMGEKFDQSAGQAMPAGTFFCMPSGMKHFAWTTGETVIQLSGIGPMGITYLNPADDPRNAKQKAP